MPTLTELIERHLSDRDLSARAFAEQVGMSYPTLLSLCNKGHVPRKPEHREALRRAIGLDQDAWAAVLASSGKDSIDLPDKGPLTLQQMVVKALYAQGFSEQTFAKASGIPYPTILGITRKGAVPRDGTLSRLAEGLGIPVDDVNRAADESRTARRGETDADGPLPVAVDVTGEVPNLAQLMATAVARRGSSIAAFAREHQLPYLSLMQLIGSGVPPKDRDVLAAMAGALAVAPEIFAASLAKSQSDPTPATAGAALAVAAQRTPFQAALQQYMQSKSLTLKAFAEHSDLSVLTATRLVKHGALPSRAATHEKLRRLLNLSTEEYAKLLASSASRSETQEALEPSSAEFQHSETEEIPVDPALTPKRVEQAPEAPTGAVSEVLLDLIGRLNLRQQQALHSFLITLM